MLPLVSGRPVTMQRFPNGIGRGGFLQKQVGEYFPDWIERVTAPNRRTRQATTREQVTYMVCRPADLTTEGRIADRHGRLFLDIGRNGYAQHMAAPYAVRALPGAPVSVPLEWSELDGFDPRRHTLRRIADRLAMPDPWAGLDRAATPL